MGMGIPGTGSIGLIIGIGRGWPGSASTATDCVARCGRAVGGSGMAVGISRTSVCGIAAGMCGAPALGIHTLSPGGNLYREIP
jgi:hypothetical protein